MARDEARELDLVVWGATGYTGRLLAASLAEAAPPGLRWALGGRDRERLERLRDELGLDVALVEGDARDAASMARLAARTRVVATTVGPYARHGDALLAACAAAGTHYADLTGEVLWMRRSIDAHHDTARGSGAKLVHACGFESVPSDLGVWWLQRVAAARHGHPCGTVVHGFGPMAGGVSGGTVASAMDLVAELTGDPARRRALRDPDVLAPRAARSAPERAGVWPRRERDLDGWTAPFFMARVNQAVVRRTRALLGEPWGPGFRYGERWRARGWAEAAGVGLGTVLVPPMLAIGPLRRFVERRLPRPGEGPSAEDRARGFFRTALAGRIDGVAGPVVLRIACDLDPGYGATALMLREAALSLALDDLPPGGGVVTPAVAFGDGLVARLQRAGMRFEVEPDAPEYGQGVSAEA